MGCIFRMDVGHFKVPFIAHRKKHDGLYFGDFILKINCTIFNMNDEFEALMLFFLF